MAAMVVGCSDSDQPSEQARHRAAPPFERPEVLGRPRTSANIFYSGHSLMDRPLPDFVQSIAASSQTPNQWNRQYLVGSSIQMRTQGTDSAGRRGYRAGYNREGEGLDVIAELRAPQTINGPYDVLVITEEHTMLDSIIQADTIRQLRHYHDRFIAGTPNGLTYFYESWFAVADKADPRSWLVYERAASPIWQCVATRINVSLAAEGRADRIVSLPAGAALAALIERATQGAGMPAITRSTVFDTVDSIIGDDVHLHPLGTYYMSLVTYASVYQRSPVGAWYPTSVTQEQAKVLQAFAWEFVSRYYAEYRPLSLEQCRARLLSDEGLALLWSYIRKAYWRKDIGAVRSYVRYVRRLVESRRLFTRADLRNPFYSEPQAERDYWLRPD